MENTNEKDLEKKKKKKEKFQRMYDARVGDFDLQGDKIVSIYTRTSEYMIYEIETKEVSRSIVTEIFEDIAGTSEKKVKKYYRKYTTIREELCEVYSTFDKIVGNPSAIKQQVAALIALALNTVDDEESEPSQISLSIFNEKVENQSSQSSPKKVDSSANSESVAPDADRNLPVQEEEKKVKFSADYREVGMAFEIKDSKDNFSKTGTKHIPLVEHALLDLAHQIRKAYKYQIMSKIYYCIFAFLVCASILLFAFSTYKYDIIITSPNSVIFKLMWVIAAGSIGGFLSISFKIQEIIFPKDFSVGMIFLCSLERMFVAILAAITLFVVMRSNIFTFKIEPIFAIMAYSIMAGFSETFIPNLLRNMEKKANEKQK